MAHPVVVKTNYDSIKTLTTLWCAKPYKTNICNAPSNLFSSIYSKVFIDKVGTVTWSSRLFRIIILKSKTNDVCPF